MTASLVTPLKGNGPIFWFSAPRVNTTNGASISAWANNTSNLLSATQGTGVLQPTYNTNKSNNYPSVEFNGSQYFTVSSQDYLRITGSFMFFCVVDLASMLSANQTMFSKGVSATPNYAMMLNRTAPGKVSFFNGTAWIDSPSTFSKTGSECVVVAIYYTGSVYSFYGNGISLGTVSNSTAITSSTQTAVIGAQNADTFTNKLTGSILDMSLYGIAAPAQIFQEIYRYYANIAGLKSI